MDFYGEEYIESYELLCRPRNFKELFYLNSVTECFFCVVA